MANVRASYNEAVSKSADEQMLLNIVRLRYLHSTTFLQLSSVVTQYAWTANAGVNGAYNPGAAAPFPAANAGGSAGLAVTERPTITYTPLQGEEFVQRLATPLSAEHVLLLMRAGWGADLILNTCVHQINDVFAPYAASREGSDPFHRLADLLHELQRTHELSVEQLRGPAAKTVITVRRQADGTRSEEAHEALGLLGLSEDVDHYPVTGAMVPHLPGTIEIRARSVLGTMFHLSQGVQVPASDPAARELPTPVDAPRLVVASSERAPKDAYVQVKYRDRWFFIDEADYRSKRAFVMLTFLFNLASAPAGSGPVLTVGASG